MGFRRRCGSAVRFGGAAQEGARTEMRKYLAIITATVAALGVMSTGASAAQRHHHSHAVKAVSIGASVTSAVAIARLAHHRRHARVARVGGRGLTKWGAYGLTTVGCMAGSTILAAVIVNATEHRELTQSEAFGLVGDCIIPFIGGHILQHAAAV